MATLNVEIEFQTKVLQHNERLADPLDPATQALKEVTGKRKKSDTDHRDISRLEFLGGLYHDEKIGPFIPGRWIDKCAQNGAVFSKLGQVFKQTVRCVEDRVPLDYKGPRDIDGLWDGGFFDRRGAGNQRARIVRTRPAFPAGTKARFTLTYDENMLNERDLKMALERAGERVGLGDYRERYGRFKVAYPKK